MIEYRISCCADAQHLISRISKVLDCRRDRRPPLSSTSLSSRRPLYPTAARRHPLTVIVRRHPPPGARGRPHQSGANTELVEFDALGCPVSLLGCCHHFNDAEKHQRVPNVRTPMDDMLERVKDLGLSRPK